MKITSNIFICNLTGLNNDINFHYILANIIIKIRHFVPLYCIVGKHVDVFKTHFCFSVCSIYRNIINISSFLITDILLWLLLFFSLCIFYFSLIVHGAISLRGSRSWNQSVLRNEGKFGCWRKQRLAPDWVWTHAASDPLVIVYYVFTLLLIITFSLP